MPKDTRRGPTPDPTAPEERGKREPRRDEVADRATGRQPAPDVPDPTGADVPASDQGPPGDDAGRPPSPFPPRMDR